MRKISLFWLVVIVLFVFTQYSSFENSSKAQNINSSAKFGKADGNKTQLKNQAQIEGKLSLLNLKDNNLTTILSQPVPEINLVFTCLEAETENLNCCDGKFRIQLPQEIKEPLKRYWNTALTYNYFYIIRKKDIDRSSYKRILNNYLSDFQNFRTQIEKTSIDTLNGKRLISSFESDELLKFINKSAVDTINYVNSNSKNNTIEDIERNSFALQEIMEMSSPEIALKEFWKAAYQGDKERLIQVSPFSEINVFDRCPKEEPPSPIELVSYKDENQVGYKETNLPFSSDDLTDNIKIFARYIYASKVKWSRFRVIDERFYKDEALLKAEIADYKNDFSKGEQYAFAFKKESGEWKLIRATQLFQAELTYENIEYASPQSCK